jgi:hypothetical protein
MLLIPNEVNIQYVAYLNKRGINAAHQGQYTNHRVEFEVVVEEKL